MRDILVMTIIFGAIPFVLRWPHVGVLLWSWISYMNPHRLTWGFVYDFPVAAVVGATLLVSLVFSREPKRIPWTPLTAVWLVFVLWMCLTTVFALVPEDAHEQLSKVLKIQLIAFITLIVMTTRIRLDALVWVIVLSLGFYGVKGGVFALLTGGNYKVWGPEGSFIGGNNEIGLALVMTVPLMYYLRLSAERPWVRRALLVAMLLTALTILATYSRGALLAAGSMVMALALKSERKFVFLASVVMVIPLLIAFMPGEWWERMASIKDYQQDGSAMGRINAWNFAYNLAQDRPMVGGGFEAFRPEWFLKYAPVPDDFHDAHSVYFEILGEHGFAGLALFLLLGYLALRAGSWIIRNTPDRVEMKWHRDLAAMTQVSLVGYAVGGAFLGLAYFDFYYHLLALVVLNRSLLEKALHVDAPKALDKIPVASTVKTRLRARGNAVSKRRTGI